MIPRGCGAVIGVLMPGDDGRRWLLKTGSTEGPDSGPLRRAHNACTPAHGAEMLAPLPVDRDGFDSRRLHHFLNDSNDFQR